MSWISLAARWSELVIGNGKSHLSSYRWPNSLSHIWPHGITNLRTNLRTNIWPHCRTHISSNI